MDISSALPYITLFYCRAKMNQQCTGNTERTGSGTVPFVKATWN